jgi:CheY-like chemotaxis protein
MAIRIHTELLERSLPENAPQRPDLDRIMETTTSAADLTARLLTFSRASRVREDPADVAAVVKKSIITLRHLMSEKVPVAISAPAESCVAPVGARQLSQVLLNVALNARDAMPDGGVLRVEVARLPRNAVVLPIDIPAKTLIVLTIADTGIGMNADVRDRLFEPFFTTKSELGNSGLGLSVVYGIVKETGGHIRVTSEPGAGARFDIFWPEIDAKTKPRSEPAFPVLEPASQRTRVLLVEDQPALREGLSRWLGDHGYRVVSCESGEEALARASEVDVIASDVVLRGMDGIELLARLRRSAPRLPAVLFSGHLDHLAKVRREIPDGVRFLEKPFAPEALVTTLEALVEAARAGREAALH